MSETCILLESRINRPWGQMEVGASPSEGSVRAQKCLRASWVAVPKAEVGVGRVEGRLLICSAVMIAERTHPQRPASATQSKHHYTLTLSPGSSRTSDHKEGTGRL